MLLEQHLIIAIAISTISGVDLNPHSIMNGVCILNVMRFGQLAGMYQHWTEA